MVTGQNVQSTLGLNFVENNKYKSCKHIIRIGIYNQYPAGHILYQVYFVV